MSPFDHKLLDIRTASSTLENFEVSVEEEFFAYRFVLLILGIVLMSLASFLSKSLAFYYSSTMAVGVILVILMILYQLTYYCSMLSFPHFHSFNHTIENLIM
ncbi:hypothetical protein HN51_038907 [Arachis hypogaea]